MHDVGALPPYAWTSSSSTSQRRRRGPTPSSTRRERRHRPRERDRRSVFESNRMFAPRAAGPMDATTTTTTTSLGKAAALKRATRVTTRARRGRRASGSVVRAHGPGGGAHLSPEDAVEARTRRETQKMVSGWAQGSHEEGVGERRKVYVETYGCQMNVNDSEVMMSVLESAGYDATDDVNGANVILINTCAIRDKAEAKIWQRLAYFRSLGNGKKKAEKPDLKLEQKVVLKQEQKHQQVKKMYSQA